MRVPSLQRVFGKLAISPDEGDLRLGRRLLALGNSGEARFNQSVSRDELATEHQKIPDDDCLQSRTGQLGGSCGHGEHVMTMQHQKLALASFWRTQQLSGFCHQQVDCQQPTHLCVGSQTKLTNQFLVHSNISARLPRTLTLVSPWQACFSYDAERQLLN